jgi:hypothetical protein
VLTGALLYGRPLLGTAAACLVFGVAIVLSPPYISWRSLLLAVVAVVLFIPIRRFAFPGALPIQLEPYRLLVGLVLIGWGASLLVDSRVRVRRTGLEGPLLLICLAVFGSIVANPAGVSAAATDVLKAVMFFVSFVLFYYFVTSVVRTPADVERVVAALVIGCTVVALASVVEFRSGFNIFAYMDKLPGIEAIPTFSQEDARGGHPRAYGSSEHPIALGALFVVVLPLAIYLAIKKRGLWWIPVVALPMGVMTTLSRTGAVMLVVTVVVYAILRPQTMRRMIPIFIVAAIAIKLAVPGAVGTLRYQFFPKGGLVAEQSTSKGSLQAGNRLTDIGPVLHDVARKPVLGIGYGARVRGLAVKDGRILDDQWLGSLYDTGILGFFGWLWLFWRFCRRVGRSAVEDHSVEGWLKVGLLASAASFAVGMVTFDAFSFTQVTFIFYIVLAIGSIVVLQPQLRRARSPRQSVSAIS